MEQPSLVRSEMPGRKTCACIDGHLKLYSKAKSIVLASDGIFDVLLSRQFVDLCVQNEECVIDDDDRYDDRTNIPCVFCPPR